MAKLGTQAHRHLFLLAPHQNVGHGAERRVAHHAPEGQFLFVKSLVVLRRRYAHGIVIGIDGLDEHDPRHAAASRAPGHLREQLKGALGRAEIRHAQPHIRRHHAHQRDIGDVVPLGDHLRAHQNAVVPYCHDRLSKRQTYHR